MAITSTNALNEPRAFSVGPTKIQIKTYSVATGATSGTIQADQLSQLDHIIVDGRIRHTAAPTVSGNTATLAFTVLAEVKASLIVQDLTYTAVAGLGASGNNITIAYTGGATAGSEVVTVTSNAISIQIQTGVSTATQVKAAFDASAAAVALASVAVSGTGSTAQVTAAAAPLADGIFGGNNGTVLCIGR